MISLGGFCPNERDQLTDQPKEMIEELSYRKRRRSQRNFMNNYSNSLNLGFMNSLF